MKPIDLSIDDNDPTDGPATREQLILMSVLEELLAEDAERARTGNASERVRQVRRAEKIGTTAPELRARHVETARRAIVTDDDAQKRLIESHRHPKQLR